MGIELSDARTASRRRGELGHSVRRPGDGRGVHRRRDGGLWQALLAQWPAVLVLLIAVTGLAVVGSDHFRRGTVIFAAAVCLAALLRAAVPSRAVGMLRLRGRFADVVTLAVLGSATLVAAIVVPPPS